MPDDLKLLRISTSPIENARGTPYIVSNETGQAALFAQLQRLPPSPSNAAHIGFAFWLNLDIIALRRPQVAVLCDIDYSMHGVYQCFREAVSQSTEESFVDCFLQLIEMRKLSSFPVESLRIQLDQQRRSGWLATAENFAYVKQLCGNDKMEFLNLNITDSEAINKLSAWIEKNNYVVDTLYASNIYEWLKHSSQSMRDAYLLNMESLLQEQTTFIDAFYPFAFQEMEKGPPLRVSVGKNLPCYDKRPLGKFRMTSNFPRENKNTAKRLKFDGDPSSGPSI